MAHSPKKGSSVEAYVGLGKEDSPEQTPNSGLERGRPSRIARARDMFAAPSPL
jgi:hypothetical protein